MLRVAAIMAISVCACAAILDRIAIVVDKTVITERQIDEEIRVTGLLNAEPVTETPEARRSAAARLIEQELVKRETLLTRYPSPTDAEISRLYASTEAALGGPESLKRSLIDHGITADLLKAHLMLQLTVLRFVNERFRPDVEISDQDIAAYYEKQATEWKKKHEGPPPPLEASRGVIRQALSDQRSESLLSNWLDETRRNVRIDYLDKSLSPR